jgi:hypothetical protein
MRAVQKVDLPAPAGPYSGQHAARWAGAAGIRRTITSVPNLLMVAMGARARRSAGEIVYKPAAGTLRHSAGAGR